MAHFDEKECDNVQKLALAFEELDDCFIEAVRDAVIAPALISQRTASDFRANVLKVMRGAVTAPVQDSGTTSAAGISEIDLQNLEAARSSYHASNFDMNDMFQYFRSFRNHKRTWKSVTSSLLKAYAKTSTTQTFEWKIRVRAMLSTGNKAWQLAIPCSTSFAQMEDIRLEIINSITEKFEIFDDFIDQIWHDIGETDKRVRFRDEFQDTLAALIHLSRTNGRYAPLEYAMIVRTKNNIRQQRLEQEAALQALTAPTIEDVDLKPASVEPNLVVDISTHKWDATMSAVVGGFVLISSLLGYKAWQYSPHEPGTVKDADFWFLLQSSSMQLLGVLTIVFPLLQSNTLTFQSRTWTWIFVATSFACTTASVPLYLYIPTEWSSMLSFVGSAVQALVILQMMFSIG